MGGARCSYRNCTAKTDGNKTHLFHYPVYAKQRCHQWLVNAQKMNFIDLSVSQLKNRVICQHHFTDDQFMNCMKNKLKHDAVPGQNGPYCTDPDIEDEDEKELLENGLSLIEDIENEVRLTANEKQASKVLKYADFLTSHDSEADYLVHKKVPSQKDELLTTYFTDNKLLAFNSAPQKKKPQIRNYFTCKALPSDSTSVKSEKESNKTQINKAPDKFTFVSDNVASKNLSKQLSTRNNKIEILSETKLTTAPDINAEKMVMLSPSTLINPHKQCKQLPIEFEPRIERQQNIKKENRMSFNEKQTTGEVLPYDVIINNDIQPENHMIIDQNITDIANLPFVFLDETNCIPTKVTTVANVVTKNAAVDQLERVTPIKPADSGKSSSPAKSKMPPERKAAIEEKRNFNKKLRDMIEFCLDELDDPEKAKNASNKVKTTTSSSTTMKSVKTLEKSATIGGSPVNKRSILKSAKNNQTEKSVEDVQKEMIQKVLSSQQAGRDSAINALEARMARMEELLVKKIDNNTQQIAELKNHITNSDNFSRSLKEHEAAFKKRLYQEMSQYLSPAAKGLVYEELFINKYGKNEPEPKEAPEPCETRSSKRKKRS